MNRPKIALTIGDPCGIGPEITVKALGHAEVFETCVPVVIGHRGILERAIALTGAALDIHQIKEPCQALGQAGAIDLISLNEPGLETLEPGTVQARAGRAAFSFIQKSIELGLSGEVQAVATGPINKEALRAAQVPFIGHTEIFGALTGAEDPLTIFEVRGLRIFFLSRHVSLREACGLVTKERLMDYIDRCSKALEMLGVTEGELAVAGLNPHCGEHGLFGSEELNAVAPSVREMRARGYRVAGPIGADSVFYQALKGRYSSVLSLYHDQGHIAAKTLDFERTISITAGLPFLRTSVDHGTAFDIAGKNLASEVSTVEALKVAAKYAGNFRR